MTTETDEQFLQMLLTLLSMRIANDCGAVDMDKEMQEEWHQACIAALSVAAKRFGYTVTLQ